MCEAQDIEAETTERIPYADKLIKERYFCANAILNGRDNEFKQAGHMVEISESLMYARYTGDDTGRLAIDLQMIPLTMVRAEDRCLVEHGCHDLNIDGLINGNYSVSQVW